MTPREATLHLAEWIAADIEEAQTAVTSQPPSVQRRILNEALQQALTSQGPTEEYTVRLFSIAQAILSGSYPFFNGSQAVRMLDRIITFSQTATNWEVRERAFTVGALLVNRVRDEFQELPESVTGDLKQLIEATDSPAQKSLITTMLSRINAAGHRKSVARRNQKRQFDVPSLDISQASTNVRDDVDGDWYQDPWGWPEVEWLGRLQLPVIERLRTDDCGWTVPIDVNKRGGGVRPGLVINPLDRVAFQALADELSVEAAGHVPSWAYGWRLSREARTKGRFESNKEEWKLFSRRVTALCKQFRFTAHLDIHAFFATVDTSALLSQLGRRYRNAAVLDRLESYLHAWHQSPNGAGIPQRSLASSVLAHAVLKPVDTFLDKKSNAGRSNDFLASRWMDDIWLHSDSEDELREAVIELESLLAEIRLSLNSEKTAIFESKDADQYVQLVDEYKDGAKDPNLTLTELLERTEKLHEPPAFQIGLEVSKILKHQNFSALERMSESDFLQYNYAADRFAKALRASGEWKRFTDPYLALARTHVSEENLVVALWAEMFPNRPENAVRKVYDFFATNLSAKLQRVVVPLAAQRLAAWTPLFFGSRAADLDLENLLNCDDVFRTRGICLAFLGIRALREPIVAALRERDNLAAKFFDDIGHAPLALSPRFATE